MDPRTEHVKRHLLAQIRALAELNNDHSMWYNMQWANLVGVISGVFVSLGICLLYEDAKEKRATEKEVKVFIDRLAFLNTPDKANLQDRLRLLKDELAKEQKIGPLSN